MILSLKDIHKAYGRVRALDGLSLDVPEGEFHVLLGPSSSGKTTSLRTICGLETPDSGEVSLFAQAANDAPIQGRGVAMIFQSFALYPHLKVHQNLGYPLKEMGLGRDDIQKRIGKIAELLGISHRLDHRTSQLSGGEQQRVAIGRALIREPRILLLDEPLTNLDAKLRDAMRVEFKRLHRELGITMLYATPDQLEATTMGDHISVLDEGRIIATGTPAELYDAPPNARVAALIGSPPVNLIPIKAAGGQTDLGFAQIDVDAPENTICVLRPHDLQLAPDGGGFEARVTGLEPLGDLSVVTVEASGTTLRTVLFHEKARHCAVGDVLPLRIDTNRVRFVPAH